MTTPLYIIADDLAGAHDVAVSFAKRDFAVAVLSDPNRLDRFDSADLVVLNTNTRSCSEAEAAERVGAACEAIRSRGGSLIYKKIDSTLRGHVGFEIGLVCRLMDYSLAVCAPAFPELGRTTVGGYQLLGGVPVRSADISGPDIPPDHAFIPDLLDRDAHSEIIQIDLNALHAGSPAIHKAVGRSGQGPAKAVVADLADPQCWDILLDAVTGTRAGAEAGPGAGAKVEAGPGAGAEAEAGPGAGAKVEAGAEAGGEAALADRQFPIPWMVSTLLCGSGGMAGALAERLSAAWKPRTASDRKPFSPELTREGGPVLVFACSLHDTTTRQVEKLRGRTATVHCPFDPLLIVDERCRGDEMDRMEAGVAQVLKAGRNAIVTPVRPGRLEQREWIARMAEATGGRDPASVVIENLGEVAHRLFSSVRPGGLVLTGGETASSVVHELACDGAWILEAIDTGVGLAAVSGGPHDGMGLVIKPGSFGDEHTLVKAMDRLPIQAANDARIAAGAGDARIAADAGDAQIVAGAGDAQIAAGAGDDRTVRKQPSAKLDAAGAGDAQIAADTGDVEIAADTGDVEIAAGAGDDRTVRKQPSAKLDAAGAGDDRPVIGITMGDPNGVGPEIIAKILSQPWVYELCRPMVIGHDEVLRRALPLARSGASTDHDGLGPGPCLDIHPIECPGAGLYSYGVVDVMNAAEVEIDKLNPGQVQSEAGRLAVESVKLAARQAMAGEISALVTAPMNKEAMGLAGYAHAGHTELLADVTGTAKYRLSLAFDDILVSHATTHVSLRDAIDLLSEDEILVTIDLVGNALTGMGVAAPRIAVCGLNPHAGEGGRFGDEEIRIIEPALEKARGRFVGRGWRIAGPLPPDTVFMRARKGDFDGIIGMYHDQGHIPVKAIAFDRTVNVTLGLPIIRTSVDHGTAFDIAGRGVADAGNLGEALRMAVRLIGEGWSIGNGTERGSAS